MWRAVLILAAWVGVGCPPAGSESPPLPKGGGSAGSPRVERIELLDRRHYEGYIESEDSAWVYLIQIKRPRGQPMHLVTRAFDRRSVALVERLDSDQRKKLWDEIQQFMNRAEIEAGRMDAVVLTAAEQDGIRYLRYQGKWFTLDSTVDKLTTQRMIVRVEQIFAAYRQMLPPRATPESPPRLVVFGSVDQYRVFLARRNVKIQNLACFLEGENLVAASTQLGRFATMLTNLNAQNSQLREELDQLKARLGKRLGELAEVFRQQGLAEKDVRRLLAKERGKSEGQFDKIQKALNACDQANAQIFAQAANQTFARLYHESSHAYLENYVFPRAKYDVPLWLNEGLAMVFESGVLESDTLRIDAPNPAAMKRLKEDLRGEQPLRLRQLLAAGPGNFLLPAQAGNGAAGQYYVYAWGLAYYLAFEGQLLGSSGLEQYVRPPAKESSPAERFERLVHAPLEEFEAQWREYILGLR